MNKFDADWNEHYIKKIGGGDKPTYYIIRRADNTVGGFFKLHCFCRAYLLRFE